MFPLRAGQIKAARAMLDWSREDLAQATGLSLNTIRNLEMGTISPRHATNTIIRRVIEEAGLEFTDREGVRRRVTEVQIYQGHDSCDAFFDDLLQTVKQSGGEILAVLFSPAMLLHTCGVTEDHTERLQQLTKNAPIRCLVSEAGDAPPIAGCSLQFRAVAPRYASPLCYYVYGNKYALLFSDGGAEIRYVVFQSAGLAQPYRRHFLELWNDALPLAMPQDTPRARRA